MDFILRKNAAPVYAFLSLINTMGISETLKGKKILDCGAGGILPPLILFQQHGFDCWGIDMSDEQIMKAKEFCDKHGGKLNLRKGDMRHIPFGDECFDFVYEHYSMCHLSKRDTFLAVHEMRRVLKNGGLCFLGVISTDTWPKASFGVEKEAGQFWGDENDGEYTLHSMFTNEEANLLVSDWEVITKEKRVLFKQEDAQNTTFETWMELYPESQSTLSQEAWGKQYSQRVNLFQYVHLYYVLRKPF